MDVIEKIRQLVALMEEHDLAELEVEEPELRVKIRANSGVQHGSPQVVGGIQPIAVAPLPDTAAPAPAAGKNDSEAKAAEDLVEITSPMVGTFYRAPSDGAEPYVTVGSMVDSDTVVCIVEAMKVMNEIKSEVVGTIKEVLVSSGAAVEYGQPLFLVEPG